MQIIPSYIYQWSLLAFFIGQLPQFQNWCWCHLLLYLLFILYFEMFCRTRFTTILAFQSCMTWVQAKCCVHRWAEYIRLMCGSRWLNICNVIYARVVMRDLSRSLSILENWSCCFLWIVFENAEHADAVHLWLYYLCFLNELALWIGLGQQFRSYCISEGV